MCRCEKPNWVLSRAPGIALPAVSQCTECHNIYYGYPREAEAECKTGQEFFKILIVINYDFFNSILSSPGVSLNGLREVSLGNFAVL